MPGSVRRVLIHPDDALRRKARVVDRFGPSLMALGDDLLATLYAQGGLGLAAPQVDVGQRVIVIRGHTEGRGLVLVNPEVTNRAGSSVLIEGCLSLPDVLHRMVRSGRVEVVAQDVLGRPLRLTLDGLLAHVAQHEIDHLDGVLLIDRAEPGSAVAPRATRADFERLAADRAAIERTAAELDTLARDCGLEDT